MQTTGKGRMGVHVSRQVDLSNNEYLRRFVGKKHLPITEEQFWSTLLNYNLALPQNNQEQLNLDSRLESLCQAFIGNNLKTGNFGSLINVFLKRTSELLSLSDQESNLHIWYTFNAMFMIRTIIKYIIETGSEFQLLQHFEAMPNEEGQVLRDDDVNSVGDDVIEMGTDHTFKEDQSSTKTNTLIDIEGTNINDVEGTRIQGNTTITTGTTTTATLNAAAVAAAVLVDGSKFETFIEALVNIIVVIPVK